MLTLSAEIRKEIGKKLKSLRKEGILPAIVYGPGIKNLPLQINAKEFEKLYKTAGESTIIKLKIEDKEAPVLIKKVVRDPVSEKIIHADFYQLKMDKKITITIPLIFKGEAPAVKEKEGTLIKNIHEVEIESFPQDMPHQIEVDLSILKDIEDEIKTKDLFIPSGVKILKNPEEIVVKVTPLKVEEIPEEAPKEKIEEVEKAEEVEKVKKEKEKEEEEKEKK